jgi:hypothetical protein
MTEDWGYVGQRMSLTEHFDIRCIQFTDTAGMIFWKNGTVTAWCAQWRVQPPHWEPWLTTPDCDHHR